MALPDGLPTSTIAFGPYPDAIGVGRYGGAKGRVFIVDPHTKQRVDVLHVATDTLIVPEDADFELAEDGTGTLGPLARAGTGVTSPDWFGYTVVFTGPNAPDKKTFVLPPESPDVVRYDVLTFEDPGAQVAVPIAASLAQVEAAEAAAVDAATQAAEAQEAADEAAAAAGAALARAVEAEEAAQTAAGAAGAAAAASLSTSQGAATSAQQAATAAQTAAENAAAQATAAAGTATTAQQSAQTAATQATTAQQAATAAQTAYAATVTTGAIVGDNLVLTRSDTSQVTAGNVRGPQGIQGLQGDLSLVNSSTATGTANLAGATFTPPVTRVVTLSANLTFANLPVAPPAGYSATTTIIVKQPATGGPFTVTWPALTTLPWAGGAAAPAMPTAPNAELHVHLFWNGTAWTAYYAGPVFR